MSNRTLSTLIIISLALSIYAVVNIHLPHIQIANGIMDHMDSDPERVAKMTVNGMQKIQKRIEEEAKMTMKKVLKDVAQQAENDASTPFAGNPNADVKMIYFFDYRCGFCRKNHSTITKLLEEDKNLKVIFREYPVLGDTSLTQIALAAHKQGKYEQIHNKLMGLNEQLNEEKALEIAKDIGIDVEKLKKDKDSDEVKDMITENIKLAQSMQINGTPTSIIGDSIVIPGALSFDEFKEAIDSARSGESESNTDSNDE
jgi:protein-disulfide isomerase